MLPFIIDKNVFTENLVHYYILTINIKLLTGMNSIKPN